MPKGEGQQIQRSKTQTEIQHKTVEDIFDVKRSDTRPQIPDPSAPGAEKKTSAKDKSANKQPVTVGDLKEKASNVPVTVPKKSAKTTGQTNKTTSKKKELDSVKNTIRDLHMGLEAEEEQVFSENDRGKVRRKRYASLSASDIKKRAENALKRRQNAQGIMEYDATHTGENRYKFTRIDKETLIQKIDFFKNMPSFPLAMDTDEKFIANLDENYRLCDASDLMKYWLDEAVEGGYMPADEDMSALQAKIANFTEVRKYLDAQKELMKNPYYQYLAKDDVSYSDEEIQKLLNKSQNVVLKDYLTELSIIRSIHFVRSKGMKSASDYAKEQGKRATRILAERSEKRQVVDKFSDSTLHITGNRRFLDKDFDSRFTPELFEDTMRRFKAMNIKDLHIGSIMDIADHIDENQYMFDQVHDFEHLLFVAVQRGLAPADNELIELRARIQAFTKVEGIAALVRSRILRNPEEFTNGKTYKESEDDINYSMSNTNLDSVPVPKLGCDLDKYLASVTKTLKQEHKDRKKTITIMYGLTHPEMGEEDMVPGQISEDELARRMAEYEKNAVCRQYMRNLEYYISSIYNSHLSAVTFAHAKRTGRPIYGDLGRILAPYLTGKTSDEIIRVIDIMQTGTDEDREQLFIDISKETYDVNPGSLDTHDPKEFFANAAAKVRIAKFIGNQAGSGSDFEKYIHKNKDILAKNTVYYYAGLANDYYSSYCQAAPCVQMAAIEYEDWFKIDTGSMKTLINQIDDDGRIKIGNKTYTLSSKEFNRIDKSLDRLDFMYTTGLSRLHSERSKKGIRDSARVAFYDEAKEAGLVKALTAEDVKELSKFYQDFKEDAAFSDSIRHYDGLIKDDKAKDAGSKQQKAETIEEVFKSVMSFDIGRMDFKSYKDIISDPARFKECYQVTRLADKALEYINTYKDLRMEEDVRCRLNNIHVEEIRSRCDLLKCAAPLFDDRFKSVVCSDQIAKTGMALDDILHLTTQELEDKTKAAASDPELKKFWTQVTLLTQDMGRFDIQVPLSQLESGIRFKNNLHEKSRAMETLHILNGEESIFAGLESGKLTLGGLNQNDFVMQFANVSTEKDFTVSEREAKLFNKKSRLYKKRLTSEKLAEKANYIIEDMVSAKRAITLKNRMNVGEKTLGYLCAFMDGNAEVDNSLAERYADASQRQDVLDIMTMEIMELDLNINVADDAGFSENAGKLEEISRKARAYDALLKANPEYVGRLMNRAPGSTLSDLDRVNTRLNQMLAISDYYRARKVLITDSYYILHYNDEISSDKDQTYNEDQRRVAELIRLVSLCMNRLAGNDSRTRENTGLDSILAKVETTARYNAHLTGRPDLTTVDAAKVHKNQKQIGKYLEAAGGMDISREDIIDSDDNKPFPEAEKYKTKAAKDYLDAVKSHLLKARIDKRQFTPRQSELYDALRKKFVGKDGEPLTGAAFRDPVTGEAFGFGTDLQRMYTNLVLDFYKGYSNAEILDVFDGLLLTKQTDIDLKNEEQRKYARERYLDSLEKLFRMEYENMKRYENTYGTLVDDIPFGIFVQSMGSGQKDFIMRNQWAQEMAELTDTDGESNCVSDGQNMTVAQVLAKYGRITQEEMNDALQICDYYQNISVVQNDYFFNINPYVADEVVRTKDRFQRPTLEKCQYRKDHRKVTGPTLTQGEARKIWKDTLKYEKDYLLTGGDTYVNFQKNRLDLYSPAQKKALKEQRKKDAGILHFYNSYLDDREEVLIRKTKAAVGDDVSEELIKQLIAFHPAMLKTGKITKQGEQPVAGTDKYYELVKKFAGVGVADDEKDAARKEAASAFANIFNDTFSSYKALSTEDLMNGQTPDEADFQARRSASEIRQNSKLFVGEVRHRMYESILRMDNDLDGDSVLGTSITATLKRRLTEQLSQEIFRHMLTNSFYLELKDVGSKRASYPERMYQEILQTAQALANQHFDLDKALTEEEFRNKLAYFGIRTDGLLVFSKTTVKLDAVNVNMHPSIEVQQDENGPIVEEEQNKEKEEEPERKQEEKKSGGNINMDEEIAAQQQQNLHYEVPAIEYAQNVTAPEKGVHTAYEKQGRGTSYCWACAMSGLMNAFAGKKVSQLSDIKKRPLAIPTFEQSGVQNRKTYDDGVALVNSMYSGNEYGNPAIFGDYIQQKLPNAAVRTAIVSREAGRLDYCKRRFLETLSKNLEKGPVGMLTGGHFVLVKELRGDRLMVNNSLSADPDTLEDYGSSISQLFASSGQQVELVWLEDMNGREGEIAQQFDLNYNAEAKEFSFKNQGDVIANAPEQASYKQVHNEQTILHKNGIEASTQLYDDVVFNFVYLPKKLQAQGQAPEGQQQLQAGELPRDVSDREMTAEEKKVAEEKEAARVKRTHKRFMERDGWEFVSDEEAAQLKAESAKQKAKSAKQKAAHAIKVKINKKTEKAQLKARAEVAPEYKDAKLDEAYQKELRANLKTKKIDWAKDMAENSDLQVKARNQMDDVDKEGYIIRHVLVTQMKQILKKYPDTTADEVEATVNEYLRRLVTKSQYRFRVSSDAAKLILNSRYFSSKSKNVSQYNNLVKKQYSENTKLTAHQSIAFGSLGGDTAKELGAYRGPVDFLAAYGKVSFKLNKDRMKGRVTFMAGNSMGMSKKDYGLIGNTSFYDIKHGRAAYIDDENGEAPDITCCGENLIAIYERARALKANDWKDMNSAEHEAPHTIVDKPNQIYYEAHFHGTVGAAEIEEATMVMSKRENKPNWNFEHGEGWKKTADEIKNDKEIKGMYDCINIINAHPEAYGREGMEEMKLTLWDLNGNMVSYDELKQIFG
ncbi:MAG: hypothetical protein IJU43_08895 [Lachnospiraceae bacterium]|nr:hypothetical protein [Lachnospiraceae bacterium]